MDVDEPVPVINSTLPDEVEQLKLKVFTNIYIIYKSHLNL